MPEGKVDKNRLHLDVRVGPTQAFLSCQICGGLQFAQREIVMTTTGMTFDAPEWT